MITLADILAVDQAQIDAGQATACAFTCVCHGGYVCERAADHPANYHLAHQDDGTLVQWTVDQCPTPEELAAAAAQAAAERQAATHALFQSVDPVLLRQLLDAATASQP